MKTCSLCGRPAQWVVQLAVAGVTYGEASCGRHLNMQMDGKEVWIVVSVDAWEESGGRIPATIEVYG